MGWKEALGGSTAVLSWGCRTSNSMGTVGHCNVSQLPLCAQKEALLKPVTARMLTNEGADIVRDLVRILPHAIQGSLVLGFRYAGDVGGCGTAVP
jgi:hypothetical protein